MRAVPSAPPWFAHACTTLVLPSLPLGHPARAEIQSVEKSLCNPEGLCHQENQGGYIINKATVTMSPSNPLVMSLTELGWLSHRQS